MNCAPRYLSDIDFTSNASTLDPDSTPSVKVVSSEANIWIQFSLFLLGTVVTDGHMILAVCPPRTDNGGKGNIRTIAASSAHLTCQERERETERFYMNSHNLMHLVSRCLLLVCIFTSLR